MARILLADDDPATRDFVSRALIADGHAVTATQDGQEALDRLLAAPHEVDLLITDVQMPGLDGITLAERAVAVAPHMRILLMSGFAGELAQAQRIKSGAVRLLTKPFPLDRLRAEVIAALAGPA